MESKDMDKDKDEDKESRVRGSRPLRVLGAFSPFGLTTASAHDLAAHVPWKYSLTTAHSTRTQSLDLDLDCDRDGDRDGDRDHDEELFIIRNTVVWSAGKQVRKRFSASTAVIQAVWCRFSAVSEPLLCVLHSDSLTTYSPSGDMNSVPLPYAVASIWALPSGLLLQRAFEGPALAFSESSQMASAATPTLSNREWYREGLREVIPSMAGSRFSPAAYSVLNRRQSSSKDTIDVPFPSHFYLQHPLEEPQALQFEEAGNMCMMLDVEERIIWANDSLPYTASYHNVKKRHSLWLVKKIEEVDHTTAGKTGLSFPMLTRSSKFYLYRVWHDQSNQMVADQVFLANDDDGEHIICILLKEDKRLIALKLPQELSHEFPASSKLKIAFTLPAVSSAPIIATRPWLWRSRKQHVDLLVLAPDGNLFLYTGRHILCKLYLPPLSILKTSNHLDELLNSCEPMQTEEGLQDTRDTQIVGLCDSVQGRINVITSSDQVYRCTVSPLPFSAITASCLNALSDNLHSSYFQQIMQAFWERDIYSMEFSAGLQSVKENGKLDFEWAGLASLLIEWSSGNDSNKVNQNRDSEPSWEFLLNSTLHKRNMKSAFFSGGSLPDCRDSLMDTKSHHLEDVTLGSTGLGSMMLEILDTLHLVYEDCKLDSLHWGDLQSLACLLSKMATSLGQWNYLDHYFRDFPASVSLVQHPSFEDSKSPFDVFHFLEEKLRGETSSRSKVDVPEMLLNRNIHSVAWTRKVAAFFDLLCGNKEDGSHFSMPVQVQHGEKRTAEQKVVLAMVTEGFGLPELDRLPPGVSLPLRHALDKCREAPPPDWPAAAFALVGREDLAATKSKHTNVVVQSSGQTNVLHVAAPYMLHLRPLPVLSSGDPQESSEMEVGSVEEVVYDGMESVFNVTTQLRFGSDLRLNEVRRLLCSSRPVPIRMANPPDVSDPDIVAQQQTQLWNLAQRTTALPFGRGAFSLSTLRTLLTEALPTPKLNLAGRLPSQHDATVNLDPATGNIVDVTSWPEFHNGVAAGLRLAPCQAKITRTWIVYNRPEEPNFAHAGLLMALGFHKHLKVLAATDVYRYLAQEHEATTVGILLGMAATYCGTMDPAISKILYLHIPARHPPSFPELELPTLMQSAALLAVGMLYQGSAHRLTTEILLAEIGRKPGGDNVLEREGYALAAGLALGLVTLGRGKDAWGLADLLIEERLRYYMSGGREPGDERFHKHDGATNTFANALKSSEDSYQNNGQVMEGSMVNLDVTSPGATLALALMFLKTNCFDVAARISIPETHFALEYVRPDFILLRVLARNLILWDSVEASEDWVQSLIPVIVKQAVAAVKDGVSMLESTLGDVDMEALIQAHVNILAGACLSIGLRYAGSSNVDAQMLLYRYALYFLKEKRSAAVLSGTVGPNGHCTYVDRGTLETCLNVAILSLSVVMAGSGHLATFKLLRYLRRRADSDGAINYGNHMAISMALGFLFLGGGTLTLATNNNAIAALLIALYPRFPTAPNDHRCHLQAFRHLYVLATEARCVQTVDVDTGLLVYAPLQITTKETHMHCESSFCRVTPCLFPERGVLKHVRVCGPRYWPQNMEFFPKDLPWWEPGDSEDPFNSGFLYVKRKVGSCSYADDPFGSRSALPRSISKGFEDDKRGQNAQASNSSRINQIVSSFSADPSMLAFAQLCCSSSSSSGQDNDFDKFSPQALLECASMDRPALLQAYISLYTTVENIIDYASGRGGTFRNICSESLLLRGLKIALAYSEALSSGAVKLQGEPLLQRTFLASLGKRIDEIFSPTFPCQSQTSLLSDIANYLRSWAVPSPPNLVLLSCFLCWYDIPLHTVVSRAMKELHDSSFSSTIVVGATGSSMILPLLALLLPDTPVAGLVQVSNCILSLAL